MKKIYTKRGDKGFTYLFSGKKVAKDHAKIQVLGSIDELNSIIGIAISFSKDKKIKQELINVQKDLFLIGGCLAGSTQGEIGTLKERTEKIEQLIDKLSIKLPILTHFILPGGVKEASLLHLARTICRRAERSIIAFSRREKIKKEIPIYLNRLSDLLFIMARYTNFKSKKRR